MEYKEAIAGSLLILSSFSPHYFLPSLFLIYVFASFFKLRYFPPFVSVILLFFSPLHAFLSILPYPLLFIDKKLSLSYFLSLAFSFLFNNLLLLLSLSTLERRGVLLSGLSLLMFSAILPSLSVGDKAYMLIVAGVISALIEDKLSPRISLVAISSSLLVNFHLYFLLPLTLAFFPWLAIPFAYFNPYLLFITLKVLEKKFKYASALPALFSFLLPSLSLSLVNKREMFYLILPLVMDIYFFLIGDYNSSMFLSISLLFLLAVYNLPIKTLFQILYRVYPSLISLSLLFLAVYFYFFNLTYFALLTLTAIALVFPVKVKIKGLAFALLSLINPFAGVSVSLFDYPAFFLVVPLVGYILFHYSLLSYVFVLFGFLLYYVKNVKLKFKHVFLVVSLIYLSYALYCFFSGNVIESTYYLPFSLVFSLLSLFWRVNIQVGSKELVAFILSSFPFPFLSPLFLYLGKKVDLFPLLLISGVVSLFLTATFVNYLSIVTIIYFHV